MAISFEHAVPHPVPRERASGRLDRLVAGLAALADSFTMSVAEYRQVTPSRNRSAEPEFPSILFPFGRVD